MKLRTSMFVHPNILTAVSRIVRHNYIAANLRNMIHFHNMLFQKLSEANEYIDLWDLNMRRKPNLLYLHYPSSCSCNLFNFPMNFLLFVFVCLFSKCYTAQYSIIIIVILFSLSSCFLFLGGGEVHYLIPTSYLVQ